LALLLQNGELKQELNAIKPEYFHRLENREIFSLLALESSAEGDKPEAGYFHSLVSKEGIDQELSEHLGTLVSKPLPAMNHRGQLGALRDVIRRLEERHLRELKAEEEIRFTESPSDLPEEVHQGILEVNERLRQNQVRRNSLAQDASILP